MSDIPPEIPQLQVRGRPFPKGRSGNPAGRQPGCRNKTTLAAEALLDGEAEGLTARAVEFAHAGHATALKLCIERIIPPRRERAVRFLLPPIRSAADLAAAMGAVTAAVAEGAITLGEACQLSVVVQTFVKAIETSDFERRLQFVEQDRASGP